MTFTYNEAEYTLPDGLVDIPLSQYILWSTTYGADLTAATNAAKAIADDQERNLRLGLLMIDRLNKALSFFSTIPLVDVEENIDIKQVISYVYATDLPIVLEERPVIIDTTYPWEDATWELYGPSIGDLTNYAAFRITMDMAQKVLELAGGDWNAMSILCAAYLRLPGELTFNPTEVIIGSSREVIMRSLPMSIALPVAYSLTSAMTQFLSILGEYVPSEEV